MKIPKIIIVEGFWRVGKTQLVHFLARKLHYTVIPEPNHLHYKITRDISGWYRKQHWRRYEEALKRSHSNSGVIMERSIISSIAFDFAKQQELPWDFQKAVRGTKKLGDVLIIFLYTDIEFVKERVDGLKDQYVKDQIFTNPYFYKLYLIFYKRILPPLINGKIHFIKINRRGRFRNLKSNIQEALPVKQGFSLRKIQPPSLKEVFGKLASCR